ncbi:effector binding domain-containing protein [Listeria sp. PSOL-1]|uniref:GyrI-like domain-containing protein n=1 Tax=Listeria sp. PSOL-1 TaxID=1844999 RepID=UPI0013D0885F|nr:effector binding domain-containing protein [Listeria sp. PSOL-1]
MAITDLRFEEHEALFMIALVWQGKSLEAFHEKANKLIQEVKTLTEDTVDVDQLFNISVHNIEDGITYYSAFQASKKPRSLPEDMEWLEIPPQTYFVANHVAGTNREESYDEISRQIKERGYVPYITADFPVFDPLPFKIEIHYLNGKISKQEAYEIRIPVIKKLTSSEAVF